jgi:large subunit ribosomal protein L15
MGISDYLISPKGAKKKRKRLGRGSGSGHGKTCGHGNKGQQARGRTKASKGFEGGQMPLIRRIPKRGFINKFALDYQILNIGALSRFSENSAVTPALLKEKGLIKSDKIPVKILGGGKFGKKMEVSANAFSKGAKELIEKAGGRAILLTNEPTNQRTNEPTD